MTGAVLESTAVEEPANGRALVVAPARASTAIIAGKTAADRIAAATEIATQLDHVIKEQGLRTKIGRRCKVLPNGHEEWVDNFHIDVEAWQTLAAFLELAVVPVWTRRVIDPETNAPERVSYEVRRVVYAKGTTKRDIDKGTATVHVVETAQVDGYSWEARVEVFKDGTLMGAAEAMCSRTEEPWRKSSDHDVRTMATTRARRSAIAGVATWIVTLAGYGGSGASGTPTDVEQPSEELRLGAQNAIGYLLDGDVAAADAATQKLAEQFQGSPSVAALQAILIIASAVKTHREASG